jgi:SAM-dependent methyltransferase
MPKQNRAVHMPSEPQDPPFPYLDDLRRAYDRDADTRDAIEDPQWRTAALETWLPELPPAARLLELGPGTGQLAAHAARLGARVEGIDLSGRNVEYCRQRGVSARIGDFRALGQLDGLGLFDGIYAVNALLHVPRAGHPAAIAGARLRLLPGGRLLIINWGGRDEEGVWAGDSYVPPRFFSLYDHATFEALAFEGFEVVRRGLIATNSPNGLRPQLLDLRRVPIR